MPLSPMESNQKVAGNHGVKLAGSQRSLVWNMELEDPEAPPQWCGPVCSKCLFKVSGAQAEEQRVIPTHSELPILLKARQGVVFRLVWLEKMGSTGLDGLDAIHLAGNPHPFV